MIRSFRGGIHPKYNKQHTADKFIKETPLPRKVIISVRQHIGAPASPVVKKGDSVKKGQVIAKGEAFVSGNIHASISGTVLDVGDYPHPVFGSSCSIVIENDFKDEWVEGIPLKRDWKNISEDDMRNIIKMAGVVGMGGATFPTHVKLTPNADKNIDTLIINGAECEPFLTADHRLMVEEAEKIREGILITMKVLGVKKGYVGIEDNKPDAIEVMKKALKDTEVDIAILPTKYPQGAEKMLIKMILNREVPSGKLPMDVGVVVQNVGTIIAIYNAVVNGTPLIDRVTTVSGSAINSPQNLLLRIGTTFKDAIEACDGFKETPEKIIMGGPMMGFAQSTLDVPIIKGTSGILAFSKEDVNANAQSPCIRCGRCVEACPMGLNPSMLSILGEKSLYEEAKEDFHLLDCIECGCCTFSCPAKRNIVQYVKYLKTQNAIHASKDKR